MNTVEYAMTLKDLQGSAKISAFLAHLYKMIIGACCAVAGLLLLISYAIFKLDLLLFLGFIALGVALYMLYVWTRSLRSRTVTMAWNFKKYSVYKFHYIFSRNGDEFCDSCKETGAKVFFMKSKIERIIYTKREIHIVVSGGTYISLPNKKEIVELLRG